MLEVNVIGTAALLAAARECGTDPRVLVTSSAEVYGAVTDPDRLPLSEGSPTAPLTPYAASKLAAEAVVTQAVPRSRPAGDHRASLQPHRTGPVALVRGVRPRQAHRRRRAQPARDSIPVGNLSARRDFTDVRDVVRAYRLLVESGQPGEVYNVCSGRDVSIEEIAETKRASELLNEMQRENRRLAVAIDEYGGVAGLVTVEDLIEEIVGDLRDEGESRNEVVRESEHSYIVPGTLEAGRLEELLDVRLAEDWHATTVGGLVTEIAGHIPHPGEVMQEGELRFEVIESTARRVGKVRVLTRPPNPSLAEFGSLEFHSKVIPFRNSIHWTRWNSIVVCAQDS